MRSKVIIVHGTQGSPQGNWFPWLAEKLKASNVDVVVPKFPTPEGQSFAAWREVFLRAIDRPQTEIILVGHSIGAPFVLRMAEETSMPYRALLAVCPFARSLGIPGYDELNASFVEHAFAWERIKKGAAQRLCFAGANDPYVPLAFARDVAAQADATLTVVPGGGHLNAEFGYLSFPDLWTRLCELL